MAYDATLGTRTANADYSQWSIEELWQLAAQMRVTGARSMSRRELIDLFAVPQNPVAKRCN